MGSTTDRNYESRKLEERVIYIPKHARFIPTSVSRSGNKNAVFSHGPEKFENYFDYFFFIHIDPSVRFWHWTGMIIGLGFFIRLAIFWNHWPTNVIAYLPGVFFFYGFGIFAHYAYDGGSAKTEIKHFLDTMPCVIYFNLLTASGLYPRRLNRFIKQYPFVVEAWGLVPKDLKGKNYGP